MTINLREYQSSPDHRKWELAARGHPIAQGVMPLFVSVHGRLFSIGTAFTPGELHFMVTATHKVAKLLISCRPSHAPRSAFAKTVDLLAVFVRDTLARALLIARSTRVYVRSDRNLNGPRPADRSGSFG